MMFFSIAHAAMAHPTVTTCQRNETVAFYCEGSEMTVALCLADDQDIKQIKVVFRLAKGYSSPEHIYPATGKGHFLLSSGGGTKGREERVRFLSDGIEYLVYSGSDGYIGNYAGVLIRRDGRRFSQVKCALNNEEPWPIHLPNSLVEQEPYDRGITTP